MTQWKLVPVEPTREMIEAAFGAINYTMPEPSEDAGRVYSAMLSAAPSPDGEEVERVARAINPRAWEVMDHELRETQEKYAGQRVSWPVSQFQHKESMDQARAALSAMCPAPKLTEEERPIWGVWVDYNRAPPGSYACLVSSFENGQWSEPEAQWMPAQGRPKLEGKIRVMPHLMPGDPLIDKLTEAG